MHCTSNAYFSIAYSLIKKLSIWKSWYLDHTLEQGDILFKSVGIEQQLAVDELPINFKIENFDYDLQYISINVSEENKHQILDSLGRRRKSFYNRPYSESHNVNEEKKRRYYSENIDFIREKHALYYNENAAFIKEKQCSYYAKKCGLIAEKRQNYCKKNSETISKKKKEYYIQNRDTIRKKTEHILFLSLEKNVLRGTVKIL